ncbi:MAG: toll/interleukin-1 receptor domain-containing protein [Promethearchaeota archaeon]
MSEEKEKWEKIEWLIFYLDKFRKGFGQYADHRASFGKGLISLGKEKISIGDYSISYFNIIRTEKEKLFYINVYCTEGINYKLVIRGGGGRKSAKARDTVFSRLTQKLKEFEEKKKSKAVEFINNLPNLYREITLDDLSSRTGLERVELVKIIESMILKEDLKAEISGNTLKLKKESDVITSPKGYETNISEIQKFERKEGLLIFVSYATKDAELYKIPELAHKLESYKKIGEVLYWQEDMHDSIIEYMNINLGRCDVVLLFCSPNALDSVPVNKEWMAAEALKKPIIPIFVKPEHIPPLLSDRLGFEFDTFDFQKNIQEIYELILKKKES